MIKECDDFEVTSPTSKSTAKGRESWGWPEHSKSTVLFRGKPLALQTFGAVVLCAQRKVAPGLYLALLGGIRVAWYDDGIPDFPDPWFGMKRTKPYVSVESMAVVVVVDDAGTVLQETVIGHTWLMGPPQPEPPPSMLYRPIFQSIVDTHLEDQVLDVDLFSGFCFSIGPRSAQMIFRRLLSGIRELLFETSRPSLQKQNFGWNGEIRTVQGRERVIIVRSVPRTLRWWWSVKPKVKHPEELFGPWANP